LEKIKSNRLASLDLARFVAMLLMVQGHTIYAMIAPEQTLGSDAWGVWAWIRGFTAPMFLTVSGIVQVFANRRSEDGKLNSNLIKRRITTALIVLIIGYLLAFPAGKIFDLPFIAGKYWSYFFRVNILQLIGVTLLWSLFYFRITRGDKSLMILSFSTFIIITVLTPFASNISQILSLHEIFDAYLHSGTGSLFPIIPYSAYLFFGIFLGVVVKSWEKEERENKIIKYFILGGLVLVLFSLIFSGGNSSLWSLLTGFSGDNPFIIILREGFVMMAIGGLTILHLFIKKWSDIYSMFGRHSLVLYVLHLIIIYGGDGLFGLKQNFGLNTFSAGESILTAFFVLAFSLGIIWIYNYFSSNYKLGKMIFHSLPIFYLGYMLLI
jgi:uncharacterized membrane protein